MRKNWRLIERKKITSHSVSRWFAVMVHQGVFFHSVVFHSNFLSVFPFCVFLYFYFLSAERLDWIDIISPKILLNIFSKAVSVCNGCRHEFDVTNVHGKAVKATEEEERFLENSKPKACYRHPFRHQNK